VIPLHQAMGEVFDVTVKKFLDTVTKNLMFLSRSLIYGLYFSEAADEAFVNKYHCHYCSRVSPVMVKKYTRAYCVRYIEDVRGQLFMRSKNIVVDFAHGYCKVCGHDIAQPMFDVRNCESFCRAVEYLRRNKKIKAIKVYESGVPC